MLSKFKKENLEFDTTTLLVELNVVLNKGVKNILKDFMKRYELLEETHSAILNLPNIKGYIDNTNDFDEKNISEINSELGLDLCEINNLDDVVFEKQDNISYDEFINFQKSTNNVIDLLISQIDVLKNEIRDLKDSSKKNSTFEKQNIKLIIEEEEEVEEEEVEEEEVEEEVEEEEEEEEEVEEEEVEEEEVEEVEEEEVEEEEVEEEVEEEEEVKSVETETKNDQEEDDDEEELIEIEIDDKTYCTNDENNGFIYELDNDGDVGKKVGYLKDGDAYFY